MPLVRCIDVVYNNKLFLYEFVILGVPACRAIRLRTV